MPIHCTAYLLPWILTLHDLGLLSISFFMLKIGWFCCLLLLTIPASVRIRFCCCGWLLGCWQSAHFFTRATCSDNLLVRNIPFLALENDVITRPTYYFAFWVANSHFLFYFPHRWSFWFPQHLSSRSFALLPIISWQWRLVSPVLGCSHSIILSVWSGILHWSSLLKI